MSDARACDSCGTDTAFIRRARCASCNGLVHPGCRDDEGVCYVCRWRTARREGRPIAHPQFVGPEPYLNGKTE